jgi:hypothetical protein
MTRTSTSKKSPRAEFGQLALGLFSGGSMGTFIVLRNRNRKLSSFDHFFWGAGPGRSGDGRGSKGFQVPKSFDDALA